MACFCSNDTPPDANRVEDRWCDKPCAGYPFEMCGSALVVGDVDLLDTNGRVGEGVGAGAYANVMLVGSSLAPGTAITPPPSLRVPAVVAPSSVSVPAVAGNISDKGPTPATATAAAAKGSLHPEVRNDSQSAEEDKPSDDNQDSTEEGGDDQDPTVEGGDEGEGEEDSEGEDKDGEGEEGEESEEGEEDEEEEEDDGDEDGSEDEDQPGNSGKALSGHGNKSSSKIPFASISVAVACLAGICALLIYMDKKRKRERVRAAWVESVFGADGRSASQGGPSPGPYSNSTMNSAMTGRMMSEVSHPSAGGLYQQRNSNLYDDRNPMINGTQTDRKKEKGKMVDRRQSTASTVAGVVATPMSTEGIGGTRRGSTMSRTIHNTVLLPAPAVRGSYGATSAATTTWEGGYSNFRGSEPQHNDEYQHHQHQHYPSNDRHKEFFDQDECEVDAAELAHLAIDYLPSPGAALATPPTRVQRPAAVVHSKNKKGVRTSIHPHQSSGSPFDQPTTMTSNSNGNDGSGENDYYDDDPFQDRREHLHHHQHQHQHHHQQQRHSMHTSVAAGGGGGHRSSVVGVSNYRRPHSFSTGNQGADGVGMREVIDAEPRTLSYRTHVLDESSDQDGIVDSEVAAIVASSSSAAASGTGGTTNRGTVGKLSGNLLKDHFKRLSTPYVKAIRDQQQHQATDPTSLLCTEEGLSHKDVDLMIGGGGNGYESMMPVPGPASGGERRWNRALLKGVGGGRGHRREFSGERLGATEELFGDEQDVISRGDKGHGYFRGHRQVHSGSLASFRGLDDPSNPRLRVMNPDDGVS
ncbi:hypothetical protein BG015_002242 [Linnemannia schmuckeri]|uniref:WSC domain-containing protein n=1 Tax=Linnemannia schmuckeri TaxID=64567 RepID=A0A9P5RQN3_9FUNG|nr:hypothetical protein BG015_002242 [Linnemannia schmuckeri]